MKQKKVRVTTTPTVGFDPTLGPADLPNPSAEALHACRAWWPYSPVMREAMARVLDEFAAPPAALPDGRKFPMKFKLEIDCDNAAFGDDPAPELAAIMRSLGESLAAGVLEAGHGGTRIRDVNGNTVGWCGYWGSPK